MRKVTFDTCHKVENKVSSKFGNMETIYNKDTKISFVLLHGNVIAIYKHNNRKNKLFIRSAGWYTVTTKDRLNGLLSYFGHKIKISQKNFCWYIGEKEYYKAKKETLYPYRNSYKGLYFINPLNY